MSFNLTLATPEAVICVTDRRLTRDGQVLSERSTKLVTFQCCDAHGVVTYNGIGTDSQAVTPADWLFEIPDLGKMKIDAFVRAIRDDADRRISDEREKGRPDVRHSFVVAGYRMLRPFVAMISNYESLRNDASAPLGKPGFEIDWWWMSVPARSRTPHLLLATGALPRSKRRLRDGMLHKMKPRTKASVLLARMVKAVRDVAYGQGRRGSVGTSVLSAIVTPFGDFEVNDHIPGGATLREQPGFIGPDRMVKDIYVDVSANPRWRYDPSIGKGRIEEPPCSNCGVPVPEGYAKCGACDQPIAQ